MPCLRRFPCDTASRADCTTGECSTMRRTVEIGKHSRKLIEIRKAFRHATLTSEGLLPIEGAILLEEAQRSGIDIVDVFRRKGTDLPALQSASIFDVSSDIFKTIQDTEHSQGIVATVRPPHYTLENVVRISPQLILVLSRLQDPGNVGTILRIGERSEE